MLSSGKRKRKRSRSRPAPTYRLANKVTEDSGKPIYCVQFNFEDLRHKDMFAAVGGRRASIYRLFESGEVEAVQVYLDENKDEDLYTCAWSLNVKTGAPWLVVAGRLGIIKVINCHTRALVRSLQGHGDAINELRLHPGDPRVVLSASKDQSVRMWSLETGVCIAIFAGENGHRDEALSIDFHLSGDRITSSSMDRTIKTWDISHLRDQIAASHKPRPEGPESRRVSPKSEQFPLISTSRVHGNYVDCVRYFGDLLLSKSVEDVIELWTAKEPKRPKLTRMPNTPVRALHSFKMNDCDIWYIRFALDVSQKQLAVGNKSGTIYLWSLENPTRAPTRLEPPSFAAAVRHVAFDYSGKHVLAVCDNASILVWQRSDKGNAATNGDESDASRPTQGSSSSDTVNQSVNGDDEKQA